MQSSEKRGRPGGGLGGGGGGGLGGGAGSTHHVEAGGQLKQQPAVLVELLQRHVAQRHQQVSQRGLLRAV